MRDLMIAASGLALLAGAAEARTLTVAPGGDVQGPGARLHREDGAALSVTAHGLS
jgi:hypothetical protein